MQDLDRDEAPHVGLLGLVDRAHAAGSDLLQNSELVRDLAPEVRVRHGASIPLARPSRGRTRMLPCVVREARPFPFELLPRTSRADVLSLRRCARSLPLGALAEIASSTVDWLGAPLAIEALAPERCEAGARHGLADPICAAILEPLASVDAGRVVIEIEPRFAAVIVDRVLGGTGEELPPHPGALGEIERGVLAYVVARALAVSAAGVLRLAAIVTSPAALEIALGRGPLTC
ncbi:MAG: hypothetical protein M3Y87_11865, partial [Myxococcota bacterium]|nr:hypothetical protein [Myxococcota bacterium]